MNLLKLKNVCTALLFTITITFVFDACQSTSNSNETKWQIVWQDEFDGVTKQRLDSTKWGYDVGGSGWGNNQLEFDTDSSKNVSLDGAGNLAIVAIKESYKGNGYTSARILTKNRFQTTYGKIEARMKLPWGQGIWPAFWMLGADIDTVIWPGCGEIDIMEYKGQLPSRAFGSVHGPGYSGSQCKTKQFNLLNDRFDSNFHIFKIEWGKDYIKWFVDDVLYQTLTPADVTGNWVFNHSFYIIFNLAVGGSWCGNPNAETVFPQTMLIDWIRVSKEVP